MDSLDVYLEKREERRRRLKTPVKRAAAFAAKLVSGQQQQQPDANKVWIEETWCWLMMTKVCECYDTARECVSHVIVSIVYDIQ